MDRQLIIHDLIVDELERCNKLQDSFVIDQKTLPRGSLGCGNGILYRCVRENGRQYRIPIDDDELIKELKQRRYIKDGIGALKKRIKACEKFLENEAFYDPVMIEASLPERYHGLTDLDVFLQGDVNVDNWKRINKSQNPMPFRDQHYTVKGVKCRSKSEALIGIRLETRNILYQYEPELRLRSGRIVYPDYKLYLPKRRRIVYLEHFGMIDVPEYAEKSFRKMEEYEKNGIYLGLNFFFTFETGGMPLNIKLIDRKLDEILLLDEM